MKTPVIDNMIIDWYDGIIQGLIKLDDSPSWFYSNMIAWNMDEQIRVFCLLELTDEIKNQIEIIFDGKSNSEKEYIQKDEKLKSILDQVYQEAGKVLMIVKAANITEPWISKIKIQKEQLKDVYKLSVDDVVNQPEALNNFWLGKFNRA